MKADSVQTEARLLVQPGEEKALRDLAAALGGVYIALSGCFFSLLPSFPL